MEISSFSAIETEFIDRVHRVIWCNLATIDKLNRPRSRLLHPIWEGPISWIGPRPLDTTRPQYIKEQTIQVSAY